MPSLYQTVNEERFRDLCSDSREWLTLAAEVLQKLKAGFFCPKEVVDALGQNFMSPSLAEGYAFLRLWAMINTNELAIGRLHLGRQPVADRFVAENNEAIGRLADTSGVDCEAVFWGGLEDSDGYVRLGQEIALDLLGTKSEMLIEQPGGGDFPLEVGYQVYSKTLHQLAFHRKLARWPYGSSEVFLLEVPRAVHDRRWNTVLDKLGVGRGEPI